MKYKEKWEEEFEKKFKILPAIIENWESGKSIGLEVDSRESVKQFISQLLSSQKQEIIEKIEKLPQGHTPDGRNHWVSMEDIDDLIQKLKKEKNE